MPSPPSPARERGRAGDFSTQPRRFSCAPAAFTFLTDLAARRERITYADFAFDLGLGSPRRLGWLLTPLLDWCHDRGHPSLPIIVVRRADGLPSGGYAPDLIRPETERVFAYGWSSIDPPRPADLARFALPRPPAGLVDRLASELYFEDHPC